VHEGDGKREEQILQWRRKELLVIFHSSFSIFHLRPYLSDVGKKWKMENEKWKMTNNSYLSVNLRLLFPLEMLPHIPDHFRNLRR
jgi:hypothetical protein